MCSLIYYFVFNREVVPQAAGCDSERLSLEIVPMNWNKYRAEFSPVCGLLISDTKQMVYDKQICELLL